jgi:hypothetical protein
MTGLRAWSRTALVVRAVMLAAGAGALVGAGWGGGLPLVGLVIGALGLAAALIQPGGLGPAVVIGGAAGAWVVRYGGDPASATGTVLLALALAVHHQAAALAAALPPTARVDRAILVRFVRHGGIVLGAAAVVGALALLVAQPAGSSSLELLGVVAVVIAVIVPVLLSRSGAREPGAWQPGAREPGAR